MNLTRMFVFVISFVLFGSIINAEEKKLKFRGIASDSELKPVQINVSPDLLKIDKALELKSKFKFVKEFAIKTDQNLKKKKKIKFRSVNAAEGNPSKIYNDSVGSVMFLANKELGAIGAGFLVDASGIIITNWHVTKGTKGIYVWPLPKDGAVETDYLFENIDPYFGAVLAENKKEDLALIKVTGLPARIKVVQLGTNKDVGVGDTVYAIGHPNGLPWSFTVGTVSQIRKNKKWFYEDEFEHLATVIQTQTPISPGNSGGPLFGKFGKIIGINTWGAEGQNLNFAVAVDHAKKFIKANPWIAKVNSIGELVKKDYPNAQELDYNKNGVIDTWLVDDDNNGKIDTGFFDDDENGFIEGTLIDENENGVWEVTLLDKDDNGIPDVGYIDEDENEEADVIAYDYDQDGEWDKFEKIS